MNNKLEDEVNAIRKGLDESRKGLNESMKLSMSYGKNKFWQGFFLGVSVASVYYWISYEILDSSRDICEQKPAVIEPVIQEDSDKLNYSLKP